MLVCYLLYYALGSAYLDHRMTSFFCLERCYNNQHRSILSIFISVSSICGVSKCRVNDLKDRKKTDKFLVTCHRLDISLPTYGGKETAPDFFKTLV